MYLMSPDKIQLILLRQIYVFLGLTSCFVTCKTSLLYEIYSREDSEIGNRLRSILSSFIFRVNGNKKLEVKHGWVSVR